MSQGRAPLERPAGMAPPPPTNRNSIAFSEPLNLRTNRLGRDPATSPRSSSSPAAPRSQLADQQASAALSAVNILISSGGDLQDVDKKGFTPLGTACSFGAVDVVNMLLKKGAGVNNPQGERGITPLRLAVEYNNRELVSTLVAHGADFDALDSSGLTPLMYAAKVGQLGMVIQLLKEGANPNMQSPSTGLTALHIACIAGDVRAVRSLLKSKADVNITARGGVTPLHCAATRDEAGSVHLLLDHDANLNAATHEATVQGLRKHAGVVGVDSEHSLLSTEDTAIHLSTFLGNLSVTAVLLSRGANPRMPNSRGMTPLHNAAQCGYVSIAKELLSNRVLVSAVTDTGKTAIHLAALHNQVLVLDELLKSSTYNIDDQDIDGNTALQLSCLAGSKAVVACLVKHGANADIPNKCQNGCMALELAATGGHAKVVSTLLSSLPFSPSAIYLEPALVGACYGKHVDTVKFLLDHGANPLAVARFTATRVPCKPRAALMLLEGCPGFSVAAILRHVSAAKLALLELESDDGYWMELGPYIETLDLRRNRLHWLPTGLTLLPKLREVLLEGNPLTAIPGRSSSWPGVNQFLCDLDEQKESLRSRQKLVIAGHPAAGKSTLVRCLCASKGKTNCGANVATDGMHEAQNVVFQQQNRLRTSKWKGNVSFTIWDFGGQDVLYPTHQLFMCSSSIFLLVFDLSHPIDVTMKHLDYWLNAIQLMARSKPKIIVAGTHADLCGAAQITVTISKLQERYCQEMFPDITSIHVLSCKKGTGIGDLKEKLESVSRSLIKLQTVTSTWTSFLYELERRKRDNVKFLSWEAYETTARKFGVPESQLEAATRFLTDVGTIVYFGNIRACAQGLVVLNSQWLSEVVTCLVSIHKRWDTHGIIVELRSKLPSIFPVHQYPADIHQTLLEILDEFGIIHLLSNNELLIPSLLREEKPSEKISALWGTKRTPQGYKQLGRVIDFSFLPVGFFAYIQAATMRTARLSQARCMAKWRSGLLLSYSFLVGNETSNALVLLQHSTYGVGGCRLEIYLRAPAETFDSQQCVKAFVSILDNVATVLDHNYNNRCNALSRLRKVPCTHCMADPILSDNPFLFSLEHVLRELLTHKTIVFCNGIESSTRAIRIDELCPDLVFKDLMAVDDKDLRPEPDLRRLLGRGAMGRVYLAELNGVSVAVKQVLQIAGSDEFFQFQKEARLMQRFLRHPNLVALLGTTIRPPQLIIEYVPYGTLQDLIAQGHPALDDHAFRIRVALDMALGMACMHGHNPPIAHLDLKTENIFVTALTSNAPVVAKIGDFGIAQIMHANISKRKGTWPYMAPEVLLSGSSSTYDAKADVFSFGIILFELFAMKKDPYAEHKLDPQYCDSNGNFCDANLLDAIIHREVRPNITQQVSFAKLIQRCWAHNPASRPSFAELATHFKELLPFDVEELQRGHNFNGLTLSSQKKEARLKSSGNVAATLSPEERANISADIRPLFAVDVPYRISDVGCADRTLFLSHTTGHVTMFTKSRVAPPTSQKERELLEASRTAGSKSKYLQHGLRMKTWKGHSHSLDLVKVVRAPDGTETVWMSTADGMLLVVSGTTGRVVWKLAMDDIEKPLLRCMETCAISASKVQVWIGTVQQNTSAIWIISVENGNQFSFENRINVQGIVSTLALFNDHMMVGVGNRVMVFEVCSQQIIAEWAVLGNAAAKRLNRMLVLPKTGQVWTCANNVLYAHDVQFSAGVLEVTPRIDPDCSPQLSQVHTARITDVHTDAREEAVWSSSITGDIVVWRDCKPITEMHLEGKHEEVIKMQHWPCCIDGGAMVVATRFRDNSAESWKYRLLFFAMRELRPRSGGA